MVTTPSGTPAHNSQPSCPISTPLERMTCNVDYDLLVHRRTLFFTRRRAIQNTLSQFPNAYTFPPDAKSPATACNLPSLKSGPIDFQKHYAEKRDQASHLPKTPFFSENCLASSSRRRIPAKAMLIPTNPPSQSPMCSGSGTTASHPDGCIPFDQSRSKQRRSIRRYPTDIIDRIVPDIHPLRR